MKVNRIVVLSVITVGCLIAGTVLVSAQTQPNKSQPSSSAARETVSFSSVASKPAQSYKVLSKEDIYKQLGFTDNDLRVSLAKASTYSLNGTNTLDSQTNKEYIYDRMLNTTDYFQSVQGTYKHTDLKYGDNYTVDYFVQHGQNPKCLETAVYKNSNTKTIRFCDGKVGYDVRFDLDKAGNPSEKPKTVSSHGFNYEDKKNSDAISLVKAKNRVKTDSSNTNTTYYRADLTMTATARESIFAQERTIGYLSDFSKWKIVGEEKLLERNCFVISGRLSGDYCAKLGTVNYKLWVDAETGFLLKLEGYNANGKLSENLVTTSIKVDAPIDQSVFDFDYSKYQ